MGIYIMFKENTKWPRHVLLPIRNRQKSTKKEKKIHRVKKLNLEQKKELAKIINKYNLFRDGKTETDVPFIGNLGIFHIIINKKPYLLFMAYNTKHIHLFDKKKIGGEEYTKKLFWLQERDNRGLTYHLISP